MPITNAPPPVVRNVTAAGKPKATKESQSTKDRTEALVGLGQLAQVPLLATKQYADAGAVSLYWPNVAKEIAVLADTNEQIAKLIDPLIQVGPYTALIAAALPFVMQIAVNHKLVQAGAMGTVPGESLAAQIETAMVQQELEALRTQRDAEKAAAALRAEIAESRKELADVMGEAA